MSATPAARKAESRYGATGVGSSRFPNDSLPRPAPTRGPRATVQAGQGRRVSPHLQTRESSGPVLPPSDACRQREGRGAVDPVRPTSRLSVSARENASKNKGIERKLGERRGGAGSESQGSANWPWGELSSARLQLRRAPRRTSSRSFAPFCKVQKTPQSRRGPSSNSGPERDPIPEPAGGRASRLHRPVTWPPRLGRALLSLARGLWGPSRGLGQPPRPPDPDPRGIYLRKVAAAAGTGEAAPLHLSCLLLVTDEYGTILGIDLLMDGVQGNTSRGLGSESLARRAYALLCHSMACPMGSGDPRKPRQLTVGDAELHGELESLVPRLGVKLAKTPMRTWGPRPGFTFASLRARTCHVCHRHSFEVKLTPCPQCSAVLYCGEACLRADWRRCPDDVSHRFWCPRLAAFMERSGELAALPFTYTAEVTSENFNKEAFLASRGLTRGYWTQLSMLIPGPGTSSHPRGNMPSLSLLLSGDPYQLLQGDGPALMPPVPSDPPKGLFGSWQDYYSWRGLSLDSPMAVLLTYPLTVYYVITHLVPQSFPELNIQNKQSLKIHVVEAGKEFDLIMVFWELLVLLPHVALELQFVGDGLPPESDQQHFTLQRDGPKVSVRSGPGASARLSSGTKEKGGRRDLQIKVSARPYHLLQGPKPDLVIGFNSGFGLKDTWLSLLPRLQSLRVPAFFTESSEYGYTMDVQTMAGATGGGTSPPLPNPFRSPFRLRAADNCMPWYCNAFVFHLIYKPTQGSGVRPAPGPAPAVPTPAAPPAPPRRRRAEKKPGRGTRRRR